MYFRVAQIAAAFTWFGMIAAISFIEAPLKFQAPNITLALGLGIGRLVFQVLNKVELLLAFVLIVSLFFNRPMGRFSVYSFAIIVVLLILETVWLLPILDARAEQVINGTADPYSNTHFIYIGFEAVKLILLFGLGVNLTKQYLRVE